MLIYNLEIHSNVVLYPTYILMYRWNDWFIEMRVRWTFFSTLSHHVIKSNTMKVVVYRTSCTIMLMAKVRGDSKTELSIER